MVTVRLGPRLVNGAAVGIGGDCDVLGVSSCVLAGLGVCRMSFCKEAPFL